MSAPECDHEDRFPPNDDGEIVCRQCREVVGDTGAYSIDGPS